MVWYGMVWCGLVENVNLWYGIVWFGMVLYENSMLWCGMVRYSSAVGHQTNQGVMA